jgi:hypothetical protein
MKGIIQLCYYKIIDTGSWTAWDKSVFENTYREFYMQAQQFDQKGLYSTFQEILDDNPKAEQMHYLVSTAATNYIRDLKFIPEIANNSGKLCLKFQNFKFEILQSHISKKDLHRVAISFYSDSLTWIDTIGNQLLIAYGDQREALKAGREVPTDMIALQNCLSISTFQ